MVASALQVERGQVEPGEGVTLFLEEVVGHLVGDELVEGLHGGRGHAAQQLVHHAWVGRYLVVSRDSPTTVSCSFNN